jgi:hypothetical protein
MTFHKFLILMIGLTFSLVLSGCGVKPNNQKVVIVKSQDARIQSFTNTLYTAESEYNVSFAIAAYIVQEVVKATDDLVFANKEEVIAHDLIQWSQPPELGTNTFSNSITNSQNAVDAIGKADPDFQYIYTTYKTLPPSFKDEFLNMKDLMDKNVSFIQALKQGELQKDSLQNWMDDNKKIHDAYESISLEIERIQN